MGMEKIFKSPIFWSIFTLISLAFFVFFVRSNQVWKAQTDILIAPKNELAIKNIDNIVNDALYIPRGLSFWEKVLLANDTIVDNSKDLSPSDRQSLWDGKISLKRVDHSGILKIYILDANRAEAEEISRQSALVLADYLSKTYNIKTELDVKIINGPLSQPAIRYGFLILLLAALFLGFLLSIMAAGAFFGLKKVGIMAPRVALPVSLSEILKREKKTELIYPEEEIVFQKTIPNFKEEKSVQKKNTPEIRKEFVSAPVATDKKASAPDNLPVFGGSFSFENTEPEVPAEEKTEAEIQEAPQMKAASTLPSDSVLKEPTREEIQARLKSLQGDGGNKTKGKNPTPEEVKERLNKLLQGKI